MPAPPVPCAVCGQPVCPREVLLSQVLGYRRQAACLPCLARGLGHSQVTLCRHLVRHLEGRPCLWKEWNAVRHCRDNGKKACCPANLGG